jgi:hypothetical protein
MKRLSVLLGTAALAATIVAAAPAAHAGDDPEIRKNGSCSAATDWKLKLKKDDSKIETEFEVDQNVVGDKWKVRLRHDGKLYFKGTRTTKAPSGSFSIERNVPDHSGKDTIKARAVNKSTGEVCTAKASL